MSDLFLTSPFDILFKDFFNSHSSFLPAHEAKTQHPVNMYEDKEGLHMEIACTGIPKEDVDITIENSIIRIRYDKEKVTPEGRSYIYKSISQRAFNLGYKISSIFDLEKAKADYGDGLLYIHIPFTKTAKPKTLDISSKLS